MKLYFIKITKTDYKYYRIGEYVICNEITLSEIKEQHQLCYDVIEIFDNFPENMSQYTGRIGKSLSRLRDSQLIAIRQIKTGVVRLPFREKLLKSIEMEIKKHEK